MKRLLYPLIASALITIVPFLLTFENGQDIVRGIFGYDVFALLLLFIATKAKVHLPSSSRRKQIVLMVITAVIGISVVIDAWIDLQNLLSIKNWEMGWHGILPFITCGIAFIITWNLRPFSYTGIGFILFIALVAHLTFLNNYAVQPLAQFPIIDYCTRMAPKPIQRKNIADDYKSQYIVTDSVTITKDYLDSSRNNVVILVESWGVPLDINRLKKDLNLFNDISKVTTGIHNRMYSRTRTAEREDLMLRFQRDSLGRRDTIFLPKAFLDLDYKTTFLFGGDSLEHQRFRYINKIGFGQAIYGNGLNDSTMVSKIDNILADTTQKHFISWTTRNTKFPFTSDIYNCSINMVDSIYSIKLNQTLSHIMMLANKYPKTRFIIQGDHNPILSPIKFQELFYKRWVPFVVLN
ncbi:MAG: hypothetical protein IK102_11200 [Treponema sp.]|nr:hypothetical protein [Treponema sp.]